MLIKLPIKHPILVILTVALITAFSLVPLSNLAHDNALEVWYQESDPVMRDYQQFNRDFGNDLSIYIFYRSEHLFTPEALSLNRELTEALSKINQVSKVTSITNIKKLRRSLFGIDVIPLISRNNNNLEAVRQLVKVDELYLDNIISHDGESTMLRVDLASTDMSTNKQVLSDIKQVLSKADFSANHYYMIGTVPIMVEINQLSNEESGRFVLASIVMIFTLLMVTYKRLRIALLPLVVAVISVIWTLGLYAFAGNTLNMVSGIMPLIILVISIADAIHIITRYEREMQHSKVDKYITLENVLKRLFKPCLFTSLTTGGAFLAFNVSSIPPIQQLGIFTAIGVMAPLVLSFTLLPSLLCLQKANPEYWATTVVNNGIHSFLGRLTKIVARHRRTILVVGLMIFIVSVLGMRHISFLTDQINYLKNDNPIYISNTKLREWYRGVYPVEMVLESKKAGYFYTEQGMSLVREIEKRIKNFPQVMKVLSPYTFFKSLHFSMTGKWVDDVVIEKKHESIIKRLFTQKESSVGEYISEDGSKLRLSIRASWLDNQQVEKLIKGLSSNLQSLVTAKKIKFHFTGTAAMYVNLNQNIINAQIYSFIISFSVIFLMLWLLFRRFKMVLIGIIPNIMPVVISLGIIGWFDVKMDVATILIAAITLGIAVDDTIHFLYSYQQHHATSRDIHELIGRVFDSVGQPIVLTTLLLVFGFIIMTLSGFQPIVYFGIFIVLNVIFALICDLVLLPAILMSK